MGVSKNNGTPKSSILIGFSIINHPFWGTPIFGNTHRYIVHSDKNVICGLQLARSWLLHSMLREICSHRGFLGTW